MFDDLFLFAALQQRTQDKKLLVLSVRNNNEFETFKQMGWRALVTRSIMVSSPLMEGAEGFELIVEGVERETFPLVLGDLAAFTGNNLAILETAKADTVKVNFTTSPMDGAAFLPATGSDRMPESAEEMIRRLRELGYTCWASTWYRNDTPPRIWQLGDTPEMDLFPFNIVGFRDPVAASMFQFMPKIFAYQEAIVSVEQEALAERLRQEIERRDEEHQEELQTHKKYIRMLEDAMVTLQPSDKIKLRG